MEDGVVSHLSAEKAGVISDFNPMPFDPDMAWRPHSDAIAICPVQCSFYFFSAVWGITSETMIDLS